MATPAPDLPLPAGGLSLHPHRLECSSHRFRGLEARPDGAADRVLEAGSLALAIPCGLDEVRQKVAVGVARASTETAE
jgi:hypothetical protein